MNERTATARALILDLAAATAARCLRDVGVESILLKGPVLARWLYDDGSVRTYGDVDLLVSPRHTEAAVEALGAMGYKDRLESATERGAVPHARSLGAAVSGATGLPQQDPARGGAVEVDLHRTFHGIGSPDAEFWSEIASGREEITLFGEVIGTPGEPARAMLVALHAAVHGSEGGHPLDDLERALDRATDGVWVEANSMAGRLNATPAFVEGLAVVPDGLELIARLDLEASGYVPLRVRARSMPPVADGLAHLRRTSGARAKARLLARELVPTPTFMRIWSARARRGRLGLAMAYAGRPFWLIAKFPSALAALRHARKTGAG